MPVPAPYRPFTPEVSTLTPVAGVATLDLVKFDQRYMVLTLTAGVTFVSQWISTGRTVTVKVIAGAADRALVFPPWYFVTLRPTTILAGETGLLEVKWMDNTDANAVAEWYAPSTIAVPGEGGGGHGAPGHGGVAAWVTANTSDVIAYWPMSDAAPSAVMVDEGPNGYDGSYGAGVSSRSMGGQAAANFDGDSDEDTRALYSSPMGNTECCFAVVELDALGNYKALPARDGGSSERSYQWRVTTAGAIEFVKITGGVVTATSANGLIGTGAVYTVGWWWDGTNLRQYVNGSVVSTTAMGNPIGTTAAYEFGFSTGGAYRLNGATASVVLLDNSTSATIPALHDAWTSGY